MTEIPPPTNESDSERPGYSFESRRAEFVALLAHMELGNVLTLWERFNPDVTEEDVDAALAIFREAIRQRDRRANDETNPPTQ